MTLIDTTFTPLRLTASGVLMLDQRVLPSIETWLTLTSVNEMAEAIETMVVRGAPAIGIAAGYGVVLSTRQQMSTLPENSAIPTDFLAQLWADAARLRQTRPTAVNLMWALDVMVTFTEAELAKHPSAKELLVAIEEKAVSIHLEDIAACQTIGQHGAEAIIADYTQQHGQKPSQLNVMTHCNAGALATGGYGTALGVIRGLVAKGQQEGFSVHVYASETRPRLQGAKLTAWELDRDSISVTVMTDNMAASLMRAGRIDTIVVGADRIAQNGDAANKIGTYSHAISAKAHQIPFYVAAPLSTIDIALLNGDSIPIETRGTHELSHIYGTDYPKSIQFVNPGFDVTPAPLLTGIITECGVAKPHHAEKTFRQWFAEKAKHPQPIARELVLN